MNDLVIFNMESIQRLDDGPKESWRVGVESKSLRESEKVTIIKLG